LIEWFSFATSSTVSKDAFDRSRSITDAHSSRRGKEQANNRGESRRRNSGQYAWFEVLRLRGAADERKLTKYSEHRSHMAA